MPLFFGSNALYPVAVMPGRLQAISKVNPLSYQVDALRGLLLGTHAHLALDYGAWPRTSCRVPPARRCVCTAPRRDLTR